MSREFPAIVLTGARQVGKTTLLRELFPEHHYVSLDIPTTAELASQNPDLFLKRYPPPLIVDEIQYAPAIFRNLKAWIDANRELKGQLILTGSQKFSLMKEVSDSLAGRVGVAELEPLSLREIVRDQSLGNEDLPRIITRGFFPELWKEPDRTSSLYYQAYLHTYLERDVRQIVNVVSLLDFERFLRLLATRVGQILEKSSLAKDVGVKVNTISSWLSVLQASNQIILIPPYFENFGSRVVKSPKLFFCDTGFCTYLLGLDENSLLNAPILGSLWENLVCTELRKRAATTLPQGQFYFYRDAQAREIDVIYVNKGIIHFIETKWSANPDPKAAHTMTRIASKLESKVVKAGSMSVISRTKDPFDLIEGVQTSSIFDFDLV